MAGPKPQPGKPSGPPPAAAPGATPEKAKKPAAGPPGFKTYLPLLIAMTLGLLSLAGVVIWTVIALERNSKVALPDQLHADVNKEQVVETALTEVQEATIYTGGGAAAPAPVLVPNNPDDGVMQGMAGGSDDARAVPEQPEDVRLEVAPSPDVTEDTSTGPLPKIAEDGRKPWLVYSRPFTAGDRPRVAIVITGLGMSTVNTAAAIDNLPHEVTLSFDAQSPVLGSWVFRARQVGHETLLGVPMEPFDYPRSDPGPGTLLTNLAPTENLTRLLDIMRRTSGYIGITTVSGAQFTTAPEAIEPVLREINRRGLVFFDAKAAPLSVAGEIARNLGMPHAEAALRIDQVMTPEAIESALVQLARQAQQAGSAVGVAAANPLTFERINRWAARLERQGVVLAPLSATAQ
ncbi:MAG: divergent polysaccharide deacetylase family protein [Alphaproteobacteria bacterium]|nr:divergent polysaccharide deacetylase family protein [Alphaproteobacteria bacterium]